MSKYSFEFKKQVIQSYLNREGGYAYLAKKYDVPAKRAIEQWVKGKRSIIQCLTSC